jgi:flagellar protein FliO/FliZ
MDSAVDGTTLLKMLFAFVFVLSLMWLFSWALKRLGLAGRSFAPGARRRLALVEHLPLDHRRRLVIVRRDDREHLLVLGPSGETVVESNIQAPADVVVDLPVKEHKNA